MSADVFHSRGHLTGVPSFLSALTRSHPWASYAACRDSGAIWVLDANHEKHLPATVVDRLEVCATCPVSSECLRDALDSGWDIYGIWGGTTQGERRKYRKRADKVGGEVIRYVSHPGAAEELEASFPARLAAWRNKAAAYKPRIRARERTPKALAAASG
ncbi:MAG: WhiB family transcriptional regulator [Actinobacteria bacterium]|nr:WhiB family transcriptional regulator [Actinomycetota bacterium]